MARVVDTNVHLLAVDGAGIPVPSPSGKVPPWWDGSTAEQVRGHMAQAGIDHTFVVATGDYADDYIFESARRFRESFTAIAKLDVSETGAPAKLERLIHQPEVGGVRFEWRGESSDPSTWLDAAQTLDLWELANAKGIPVSLASVRKMQHLRALRRVLERYPKLTVILRRMVQPPIEGGPPYTAAEGLFELAAFPGVYSTFSDLNIEEANAGSSTHEEFFRTFLDRFGANRLMWASFFPAHRAGPDAPTKGLLDFVRENLAFLGETELDLLLGETACSVYPGIGAAVEDRRTV
jgi:predicted TIM-barrel fold metal-dependent hydrolase